MAYLHKSVFQSHGYLSSANCHVDSRWVLKISGFALHAFREKNNEEQVSRRLSWEDYYITSDGMCTYIYILQLKFRLEIIVVSGRRCNVTTELLRCSSYSVLLWTMVFLQSSFSKLFLDRVSEARFISHCFHHPPGVFVPPSKQDYSVVG